MKSLTVPVLSVLPHTKKYVVTKFQSMHAFEFERSRELSLHSLRDPIHLRKAEAID